MTSKQNSSNLYQKACKTIPGGVNSPVRAFKNMDSTPFFVDHAKGAYLFDIDQNRYIDFINSWGAIILGHAAPEVIEPVKKALERGTSFGIPHPGEVAFAETLSELIPSLENVRLTNSGTEATMSAIRVARGYTGKSKVIKFEGCYHGASDALLVKGGSGQLTLGKPDSAGVLSGATSDTLVATYNDIESINALFEAHPNDIAAIIVEPIPGNMNFIQPLPDFLPALRKRCTEEGALLIFDEVMTGFRVALGGAQSVFNIQPDLTTLGKVIGGGFPLAAFGGKKEVMQMVAPQGPVYQAGTLSGNPIAVAAGLAVLQYLKAHPKTYEVLSQKTESLLSTLSEKAKKWDIPFSTQSLGGMFGFYFTNEKSIHFYEQIKQLSNEQFKTFFHSMLNQGIYFAPSLFEAGFISLALSDENIEFVGNAADRTFEEMKRAST